MKELEVTPKKVLAVGAHPDDIDVYAGGTIAKMAAHGAEVFYAVLTDGSKGAADGSQSAEELKLARREEQRKANLALGVKSTTFFHNVDGELEATNTVKRDLTKVVREIKPDLVIGLSPTFILDSGRGHYSHRDHRKAGEITYDVLWPLARNKMSFPELNMEPHETPRLLIVHPTQGKVYIDISDQMEKKNEAIRAHVSQYGDAQIMIQQASIASKIHGYDVGCEHAERFIEMLF